MLESMTGYGRAEHISESIRAVVEIRSVNNRFCEVFIKLPYALHTFEQPLKEIIQKRVSRGKINLMVDLEHLADEADSLKIQESVLKSRLAVLEKAREIAGIKEPVSLAHLLSFDGLFESMENDPEILEKKYETVKTALEKALDDLISMRLNEGKNLQKDLESRLEALEGLCKEVAVQEKERIPEAKEKLQERLQHLMEDSRIDPERLEQEVALLADRLDISEELVRMDSHITYFRECIRNNASQGKKLNFILQEMHREVNTIGSKANHPVISKLVVEMKDLIETIREQIQNIV
ncbi:YicC/YloC family endoribonuclease [Balneolaceae bacterium ANBcel3]|nr:YicC/YloC family endoribonuclease [Balneolaceae bacterium ANBcel3]